MLSTEIFTELKTYFNIHSEMYSEGQSYLPMSLETRKTIRDAANRAESYLYEFSDENGVVAVNEENIEALSYCIEAIRLCMNANASWHRATLVLIVYRFLSHFDWNGNIPDFVEFDSWGPLIYELTPNQLSFYLWWRQQARMKVFHDATGEYTWLFIYENLLNTNIQQSYIETLDILEHVYSYYKENYPRPVHKRLTVTKLGHLIVNYALFNGLYDQIDRLGNRYGIEDEYALYYRFSKGKFSGLGRYLFGFATSDVKTKSLTGTAEEAFVIGCLPFVFNELYRYSKALRNLLVSDICGQLNHHSCWDYYESPVLSPNITRLLSHGVQESFSLNGNTYTLASEKTLSSDRELVNNQYSWFYNDRGERFHISGYYYREHFSGITSAGKSFINYVFRQIQINFRSEAGMRALRSKNCPYMEFEEGINECIQKGTEYYKSSHSNEEDISGVFDFVLLKRDDNCAPEQFKYGREANQQKKTLRFNNDDLSIEFLEIPDDVQEIGAMEYAGCTNLKAVIGGFGLKKVGTGAFLDCTNLQTVVLQDGTERIEEGAFQGCSKLEEIYIPLSVHQIGDYGDSLVFGGSPTILCYKYSAAYNYAVEHELKYKLIKND